MSSAVLASDRSDSMPRPSGRAGRRPGAAAALRWELRKLLAQWRLRFVLAVVVVGPFAFGAVMQVSQSVPADTLFGRWVHDSATAIPLVVLGFAGSWGFPILVSLVAGDVLSGEDHHGTWKTLLTRSVSRRAVVGGKVAAASIYAVVAVAVLAVCSVAAGTAFGGTRPLTGLSGQSIGGGQAVGLTLLSWLVALPGALAFGGVALLVSAWTRNSLAGVVVPVALGLLEQLVTLVDGAQGVAAALPGAGFLAWHGLFLQPWDPGAAVLSVVVALIWWVVTTAIAALIVDRRDVTS